MATLGKYDLHEELGRGGFGAVYRATDTTLGREVALKVLHPQLTTDPDFLDKFRKEARTVAQLKSRDIVTIHELGEVDGRVFIAMEYMDGGSLKDKLEKEGALSFEETLKIMRQVCAGLDIAHRKGLVHRDIKPANILFDGEGNAVISDFGLAKAVQNSSMVAMTSMGSVGTPAYRAPELWEGNNPPSPATDIYSLACVLSEMLTGEILFDGDTSSKVLAQHLIRGPKIPDDIPEKVRCILERSLSKESKARYQNIFEMLYAFEKLYLSNEYIPATKEPTQEKDIFINKFKIKNKTIVTIDEIKNEKKRLNEINKDGSNDKKARKSLLQKYRINHERSIRLRNIFLLIILIIVISVLSYIIYNNSQYSKLLEKAQELAFEAEKSKNPALKREIYLEILELTIEAEEYKVTLESRALFNDSQSFLDEMDLTTRLEFRPAMSEPFPDGVQITKIVDSTSGTYLLNSTEGNIFRVIANSKGFLEVDPDFSCVPGRYGLVEMGEIVDFVVLPANTMGYKVLAVDENGDLLYCEPGEIPDSKTLTLPEGGWGKISQIIYSEGRLFLIDALANDIFIYESLGEGELKGIAFSESPAPFFDAEVPDIGGAIEAVLNQDDLYILHKDGHMTLCQYGYENVQPTICQDPEPYTDNREGSENKKPWIFMGTDFIEMAMSSHPNPSLLLLDTINQSIFQFNKQLDLEKTYKPRIYIDFPLPEINPTGFGILLDNKIILAYGNQLFIASY